jgi:parallel beta-helix repeat protein
MKTKPLFISLTLGLGLTLGLLWLLGGRSTLVAAAPAERPLSDTTPIHYVAITGINSGSCSTPATACRTVQYAVDKAGTGDEIRVASGVYTDVNNYGGLAQVVYISKTVTIHGGYTTSNWTTPYPITQPTTLDAQGQGRVLYITGNISPTIEGLRITGGDATGLGGDPWGVGSAGGGVYIITATATLSNNQVFTNTAYFGGGLYLSSSNAKLSGNTIMSNAITADGGGGGLFLYFSPAVLSSNTVASNTAYIGGGLYLCGSAAVLSENTIMYNTTAVGGGLGLDSSDATLNGDTIVYNIATSNGGGLRLFNSGITLTNAIVAYNHAGRDGGGLFVNCSGGTFDSNIVISNTAGQNGGGLHLQQESDATLTNNIVADNWANNKGGGLYIEGSWPRLLHTTIARNGSGDGSGIYVTDEDDWYYSTVALTNTILVSHTVGIAVMAGNTALLEATLWGSGAWANGTDWAGTGTIITGTHNYWGDPAFVDPNAGDYHITAASEARDAGVNAGVDDDIDGDPRPQGGGYDIGADESLSAAPGDHKNYLPLIMRQYP